MIEQQQETQRVIYQCKRQDCKHIWAFDYEVRSRFVAGRSVYELCRLVEINGIKTYVNDDHDARCPKCKSIKVRASEVEGFYSEKHVCGGGCTSAKGPHCECQCGGANHGSSWL